MTTEFEDQDLRGAVFWGVDLRDALFRDVDFSGTRSQHVVLHDVELDGFVDRLVVNGVDVTDHVHANDPWRPLRGMLRPADTDGVRATWDEVERVWSDTIDRAQALPDGVRRERVDGEWSFVETLRHLVFAVDKWFTVPINGGSFEPIGIPNSGSADFPWPGLDPAADPTDTDVLAARQRQAVAIRRVLDDLTEVDLTRQVDVLENGTVIVLDCWHTVFEEHFEHRRYALRDLARLCGQDV
jgi:hypothetical protein